VIRVRSDGVVRVTIPRAGCRRGGEEFLLRSRTWVERQRALLRNASLARQLADGDTVLLAGAPTPVAVTRSAARLTVALGPLVATGVETLAVRDLVIRALRAHAVHDLPPRTMRMAAGVGLVPKRVTVRDQQGRWGSCSANGSISLNWRLVQMPPEVRDYILLHELMHMREPNHSRRFWQHVARVCPWHMEARRWLARHGRTLL
jgi:predicted metal-dependent hydrolase